MNEFVLKTNSHLERNIYYTDTDSLYIHIKLYEKLK